MTKEFLSKKLAFGVAYLFSGTAFTLFLNIVTVSVITRKLGVESFGFYSAVTAFVGLFQFLCSLGVNRLLLKEGVKSLDRAGVAFGNAVVLKLILAIPFVCLTLLCGYIFNYRDDKFLILFYFSLVTVFDSFSSIFVNIRRIFGHFQLISFARAFRALINLVVTFYALKINCSVVSIGLSSLIVSIISFSFSLLNSFYLIKPSFNPSQLVEVVKDSIVYAFNDFFSQSFQRVSVFCLSLFSSLHVVGVFGAAVKFINFPRIFANQVRIAVLPSIFRIIEEEKNDSIEINRPRRVFNTLFRGMLIAGVMASVFIFLFAAPIINLVFGQQYESSIPLVRILSLFIFFRFLLTPFEIYYLGAHEHTRMVLYQGGSNVFLILSCLLLIPLFGVYGVCGSIIFTELVYLVWLVIKGYSLNLWESKKIFTSILISSFCGLISVGIILAFPLNYILQLVLFLAVFFVLLLLTKQLTTQDINLVKKIFLHKRTKEKII